MNIKQKILKIFSPSQVSGIVKIDDGRRNKIIAEMNKNPHFVLLLIDNLNYLIDSIDDIMLNSSKSSIDFGITMAELIGQKKAYLQLLNLLTEQEIKGKNNE